MSFTSLLFYIYLAGVAGVFYLVPKHWRAPYLLVASYVFYMTWQPVYALLLLGATLLTYGVARFFGRIKTDRGKTLLLLLGLVPIVGVLAFFKFEGHFSGILLPLGISYYTFKLISYLLETYWDHEQVQKNFIDFALFPAFAPQIVSGPIQRPYDFFAQLSAVKGGKVDFVQIEDGFRLILGGLMMKLLIGDRLGAFIDIVDKSPADYHWTILATTVVCYTLQLYADFSGYTNIAIGIGKMFGIDSPRNFNAPFAASNIAEMWRRWHMSLTSWLTDYLFTPLQMTMRNWGTLGLVCAITINMILIGVWHGLTLNFLVFGICHAVFMVVTALTKKIRERLFKRTWLGPVAAAFGIVLTFALMTFSQLFFHTGTWADAMTHLKLLFGIMRPGPLRWGDIRVDVVAPVVVCMELAFFFGAGAPGTGWLRKRVDVIVPNWVQYGFCLLLISTLTTEAGAKFIYGQF